MSNKLVETKDNLRDCARVEFVKVAWHWEVVDPMNCVLEAVSDEETQAFKVLQEKEEEFSDRV